MSDLNLQLQCKDNCENTRNAAPEIPASLKRSHNPSRCRIRAQTPHANFDALLVSSGIAFSCIA